MKRVEILINEGASDRLLKALKQEKIQDIQVFSVSGKANGKGIELQGRAGVYHLDFWNQYCVQLLIEDDRLDSLKAVIGKVCQGVEGFLIGRMIVTPVEEVISLGFVGKPAEAAKTPETTTA